MLDAPTVNTRLIRRRPETGLFWPLATYGLIIKAALLKKHRFGTVSAFYYNRENTMRRLFRYNIERQRKTVAGSLSTMNRIAVFWLIAKGTIPVAGEGKADGDAGGRAGHDKGAQ